MVQSFKRHGHNDIISIAEKTTLGLFNTHLFGIILAMVQIKQRIFPSYCLICLPIRTVRYHLGILCAKGTMPFSFETAIDYYRLCLDGFETVLQKLSTQQCLHAGR